MSRVSVRVPLRWADMDAYGHINNVNQIRLMEEARLLAFGAPAGTGEPVPRQDKVALFEQIGEGVLILVVENTIRYLAQLPYRDVPIRADVWFDQIKGASFRLNYEFFDGHDGTLTTRATTTLALTDRDGRLKRLTPQQREDFSRYTDADREGA